MLTQIFSIPCLVSSNWNAWNILLSMANTGTYLQKLLLQSNVLYRLYALFHPQLNSTKKTNCFWASFSNLQLLSNWITVNISLQTSSDTECTDVIQRAQCLKVVNMRIDTSDIVAWAKLINTYCGRIIFHTNMVDQIPYFMLRFHRSQYFR